MLHLTMRTFMGVCLGAVGRYAEAEEHFRQARDLDPNFFWADVSLVALRVSRQMFTEALPVAEKAFSLASWYPPGVGIYAGLLVRLGQPERAGELIRSLGSGDAQGAPVGLTLFHACCGEIDQAADWFEKAIEQRNPGVTFLLQSSIAEPRRSSPRWPKLAAFMNLL